MTVSRVINGFASVQADTREKVQAAIATLGYVPNVAARALAGAKQCRVAMLYSNPSSAYLSEFLVGSLDGAAEHDAQLIIEHWDGNEPVDALARRLQSHHIDAVLLPPPLCEHQALLDALDSQSLPVAQVATGVPTGPHSTVTIDDADAAKAMTCHLLALGHRRIGFISGNQEQSVSALRRQGYEQALAEAGMPADPQLIVAGSYTYRSGLHAAEALLGLPERPTAIFASNDDMAAAAVAVAHRRRLDVPGDLSICGFDDTAIATTIWPELTTIRQPIARMAKAAMDMLNRAAHGDRSDPRPESRRLGFELIVRASSGPLTKAN